MGYKITDEKDGTLRVQGVWLAQNSESEEVMCDSESIMRRVCLELTRIDELESSSDAGADRKEERPQKPVSITREHIVWENGIAVGVLYSGHLFLFNDKSTHFYDDSYYSGLCGGGYRNCYNEYRLVTTNSDSLFVYDGPGGDIVIPDNVEIIWDRAFQDRTDVISVVISEGVTRIGECAFSGCSGLKSISIPKSVKSIAYGAFQFCSSLTNIELPEGLTSIGGYVFSGCSSLTSVVVSNGVKELLCNNFTDVDKSRLVMRRISVDMK